MNGHAKNALRVAYSHIPSLIKHLFPIPRPAFIVNSSPHSTMTWLTSTATAVRNVFKKEEARDRAHESTPSGLLIVKRGLSPAYYFFCGVFAKERGLEVVPDRRVNERRRWQRELPPGDRRANDRRRENWPNSEFTVVGEPRETPPS